jgi:DNA-directed RNA polymerase alpha subunit
MAKERPPHTTGVEARGGRIVKGGAIRRVLLISLPLAAIAMIIAFVVVQWSY